MSLDYALLAPLAAALTRAGLLADRAPTPVTRLIERTTLSTVPTGPAAQRTWLQLLPAGSVPTDLAVIGATCSSGPSPTLLSVGIGPAGAEQLAGVFTRFHYDTASGQAAYMRPARGLILVPAGSRVAVAVQTYDSTLTSSQTFHLHHARI